MVDYSKALDSLADTLAKVGEPLTETQRLLMAGGLAVWLEKAYGAGLSDMRKACEEN